MLSSVKRWTPRLLALGLTFTLAILAPVLADDVVLIEGSKLKPASGNRIRGQIKSETPAAVTIEVNGVAQVVPLDQIESVGYDGQSAEYVRANSLFNGGDLVRAAEAFQKAANDQAAKPLARQAALYGRARSLAESALADPSGQAAAITALEAFTKDNPNGRHTAGALESLAKLRILKGDLDQAAAAANQLAALKGAETRAAIVNARVAAARGNFSEAVSTLDGLLGSLPAGLPARVEALLAKAESQAGLKQFAEAETTVNEVIKSAPPEDYATLASAYQTLGDCRRVANKPKDALIAYLHVDILFNRAKDQHPKAMAQIVQLWRQLKRDDRADEVLERLRQEYPKSPYLAAATQAPPK